MLISEVCAELEKIKEEYGDIEVLKIEDSSGPYEIGKIHPSRHPYHGVIVLID